MLPVIGRLPDSRITPTPAFCRSYACSKFTGMDCAIRAFQAPRPLVAAASPSSVESRSACSLSAMTPPRRRGDTGVLCVRAPAPAPPSPLRILRLARQPLRTPGALHERDTPRALFRRGHPFQARPAPDVTIASAPSALVVSRERLANLACIQKPFPTPRTTPLFARFSQYSASAAAAENSNALR